MKWVSGVFSFGIWVFAGTSALISCSAFADSVVQPRDARSGSTGWGGGETGDSMLKSNKDPAIIRQQKEEGAPAGLKISSSCTLSSGRMVDSDDTDYQACLSELKNRRPDGSGPAGSTVGSTPAAPQSGSSTILIDSYKAPSSAKAGGGTGR